MTNYQSKLHRVDC